MAKTICVDFDGVLHGYSKKWHDGTIYDGPIPGSKEAMEYLLSLDYEVVIYSTRAYDKTVDGKFQANQVPQMTEWLAKYKIPYTRIHTGPDKPICVLFIDDNAYRFEGDWNEALNDIKLIFYKAARKPKKGDIAFCSLGYIGLITSGEPQEITYPDGNKGLAWTGIHLSEPLLGKPWSSRNPQVLKSIWDKA